jgi:hypothetical protein
MNSRQLRTERRAAAFYNHFQDHPEELLSLADVCGAIGCAPGKLSRAAMRKTRVLAEADGWWFPPAVPATLFRYVLTRDPTIFSIRRSG